MKIWSKGGIPPRARVTSLAVLIGAAGLAALVKYSWRPALAGEESDALVFLMGFSPDLLAALGIPFLWTVFGYEMRWPFRKLEFASNCFWGWLILLNNELWQLGDPDERFDPADIIAAAAGAVVAFLAYRLLVQRRGPSSGPSSASTGSSGDLTPSESAPGAD